MTRSGRCLCGAVAFTVEVTGDDASVCHCGMCRRWSAGPYMTVHAAGAPTYTSDEGLAWYRSSQWAERGFCSTCGTSLFYRLAETPDRFTAVAVEALDDASGIRIGKHIYVDHQPGHYAYADDAPRVTESEFLASMGIKPG